VALAVVFAGLTGPRPSWERAVEEWRMRQNWKHSEVMEEIRQETRRELLLDALRARFETVPEDIASAVAGMTDAVKLTRWFKHALKARSSEAFRAAVRMPTANGPHA
jgi:hypothetical protein